MSTTHATPAAGGTLPPSGLLEMLYYMRLQRAVEDRGIKLYYQGRIPGAYFTGFGHEATIVGAAYALGPEDLLAPMHRDLAAYIMRGITVGRVFAQFLDREGGPTRGRDGNVHMGDPRLGIFPFISHMAASVPVAAGMALACRQRGEARVVLTYFGDGATSTGAWHEGVNFAAVFRLPLVLVLENNQYAYSTPLDRQTAAAALVDKAPGYGIPGVAVDGNDVLAVYAAARTAVARAGRWRADVDRVPHDADAGAQRGRHLRLRAQGGAGRVGGAGPDRGLRAPAGRPGRAVAPGGRGDARADHARGRRGPRVGRGQSGTVARVGGGRGVRDRVRAPRCRR